MPNLLSSDDLDRPTIDALVAVANHLASSDRAPRFDDTVVALAFFESSMRTQVGFEVAALRLGAAPVIVPDPRHGPPMSQPESLQDGMRVLGAYCDAICIRHPDSNAPLIAAEVAGIPVVNCGNGISEHPTQALIDVFAIHRLCGKVDGLRIGIVGDLLHMRTAHSLLKTLARYTDVTVRCIAPPGLSMPAELITGFEHSPGAIEESRELELDDLDIVYVAGLPPRTASPELSPDIRAQFTITAARAGQLEEHVHILCPLPRIDEIAPEVDELSSAAYFEQSALGLPMRMAILRHVLSRPEPLAPRPAGQKAGDSS